MYRQLLIVLVWALACSACGKRKPSIPSRPAMEPAAKAIDITRLGHDRAATLRALALPFPAVVQRFGAHRLKAKSEISVEQPRGLARGSRPARREVVQAVSLVHDAQGHFHLRKDIGSQKGREVVWDGSRLYLRNRWQSFFSRAPNNKEEPRRMEAKLVGLWPAYMRLFGRFTELNVLPSAVTHGGRAAVRVELTKRAAPAKPAPATRHRASRAGLWRESIQVSALGGSVLIDKKTGVPLAVKLKVSWSFAAPSGAEPRSGIPKGLSSTTRLSASLRFSQHLYVLGKEVVKRPSPKEIVEIRRRRLELERQMVLGERKIDPRIDPAAAPIP